MNPGKPDEYFMPQYSQYYVPQGFFGMNYMWAQDGRAASPAPSTASSDSWIAESSAVSPPLSEAARPLSSAEAKKTHYDKWTKQEEELLVQLWAEKHDQLESRESRKKWVWIAEKISTTLHSNKTADKCICKMKYIIERYKKAKDWNKKQSGGNLKKSLSTMMWIKSLVVSIWWP